MRKVQSAKADGLAGYYVEGMPHTYTEDNAKRFQYMNKDGTFDYPADGVLAEVDPEKANPVKAARFRSESSSPTGPFGRPLEDVDARNPPGLDNPSGRP